MCYEFYNTLFVSFLPGTQRIVLFIWLKKYYVTIIFSDFLIKIIHIYIMMRAITLCYVSCGSSKMYICVKIVIRIPSGFVVWRVCQKKSSEKNKQMPNFKHKFIYYDVMCSNQISFLTLYYNFNFYKIDGIFCNVTNHFVCIFIFIRLFSFVFYKPTGVFIHMVSLYAMFSASLT